MDILVSSNLERLIFRIAGNDPEYTDDYIKSGTIRSGDTFELASGQTIIIAKIPAGVKYKVEELTGLEIDKINIFVEGVRVID